MANKEANVDNYDIDAIEKKMEKMSAATANRLGEPAKTSQEKQDKE